MRFEEKEKLLKEIACLKDSSKLIIVEGKKDKAALEKLGLSKIVVLNGPIYVFAENVSKVHEDVIILTDLDREGKRLYSKLKDELSKRGVKIDDSFRKFLFKETNLRQIEGLATYIEK